jgi:hypothetical protein
MVRAYGTRLAVVLIPWVETRGYKIGRADGPFCKTDNEKGLSPDRYCNHGFQPVVY